MKPTTFVVSMLVVSAPCCEALTQDSAAPESSAASAGTLEEVVVTAQHRLESLQKSSLAISAIEPAQVTNSNLTQPEGLSRLVPNLQVGQFTYSRVYLRGVGDNTATALAQSAVAMNVDGGHVTRLLNLPLADAPPGEHELLLRVKDEVSGATFEAREPFRVEGRQATAQ